MAEPLVQIKAYGVNSIGLHWNYIQIKMDAGLVWTILSTAAAGALAAFRALVAWLAANPITGVIAVAVVTSIINSLISEGIKDGVEIHYNYFYFTVTFIGRQWLKQKEFSWKKMCF